MKNIIYKLSNGKRIILEQKPLGTGGEGDIYKIVNEYAVVKLYKKDKLNKDKEEKIKHMFYNPPFDSYTPNEIINSILWIEDLVYDDMNNFVGYKMKLVSNKVELKNILIPNKKIAYDDTILQKFYSHNNKSYWKQRIAICYNLASVLEVIHQNNCYVIVDLKPENILIGENGTITLVDIDSIQVKADNQIFYAPVQTPEYSPPEFKNKEVVLYSKIEANWDYFSFAVIAYEILFQINPFVGTIDGDSTIENNIKNNYFVHGKNKYTFKVIPPPHKQFDELDDITQDFFKKNLDADKLKRKNFTYAKDIFKNLLLQSDKLGSHYNYKSNLQNKNRINSLNNINRYKKVQKTKINTYTQSTTISSYPTAQVLQKITSIHIFIGILTLYLIYLYASPYFGKYPIDFDYKHSYGAIQKFKPLKYNKYLILGEGNFVEITGKPKNGSTPLALDIYTGYKPRPYIVAKVNTRGSAVWARNKYYDGHISDIVLKNDSFIIVNDGSQHEKESFILVRKYDSSEREIFNKSYFYKQTKQNSIWAEEATETPYGYAIYVKFKKNKQYYDGIIHLDNHGNVLWSKAFLRRYSRSYKGDKIAYIDNYLYLISSYKNELGKPAYLGISKISLNGYFIWHRKYLDNNTDTTIKPEQILNLSGNIKIIGTVGNTIYDVTYKSNDSSFYDKKYSVEDSCDIRSVVLKHDGNYLAVGNTGTFDNDGCIVELDQYGKQVWSHNYTAVTSFDRIFKDNGGYIVTGYTSDWFWEDSNKEWYIMKIKDDREKVDIPFISKSSTPQIYSTQNIALYQKQIIPKYKNNKTMRYKVVHIRKNSTLNVRSAANIYSKRIGKLPYNARNIQINWCKNISNGEKWCNVLYYNINGWVNAKYLERDMNIKKYNTSANLSVVQSKKNKQLKYNNMMKADKKNHKVTKPKKKKLNRKHNVRLGKKLYRNCASCHGRTGRGKPLGKHVRLAGQTKNQIKRKLMAYKRGRRNKTGFGSIMKNKARRLNITQIDALAQYIVTF